MKTEKQSAKAKKNPVFTFKKQVGNTRNSHAASGGTGGATGTGTTGTSVTTGSLYC